MVLSSEIDSLSSSLLEVLISLQNAQHFFYICHISVISYGFEVCACVCVRVCLCVCMRSSPPLLCTFLNKH